jgi:hypothetical protein
MFSSKVHTEAASQEFRAKKSFRITSAEYEVLSDERDLTQLLDSNTGATFPFYESLTLPHLGSALTGVEREHGRWFHPSVSIESQ